MGISVGTRQIPIGAVLAAVGGLLAALGSFLPWETASGNGLTISASGFDGNGGKLIVLAGVVAIVAAAAWVLDYKLPASPGVLAIAAGVLVLIVVVYNYSGLQDDANQATQLGISASIGLGYFLDAIAGVLAIVGGVLGLQALKR